ncbi:flagella synthesis protein FlgN [Alloalcanivorax xenomutans]|uniref:flagella synthesis protein FlgN n=1 Tax=Alloalcanivorax xenomutans TaxID=1094342 RepID=UPI000BCAE20F|nr:flagellar protein FlgN [Alloalcanivorax xenomutans]SOC18593.1 flagella synthesis protein FlgN [Alloalcanivorax xenomutans]
MSLNTHLRRQHDHLVSLGHLLSEERGLLVQGSIDGPELGAVAQRKAALLETLDTFEGRRREALQRLGYDDTPQGDEQAAREAGCLPLWRAIQTRARAVATDNRVNGELIELRAANNLRLLNALREKAGTPLYGPDGQPGPRGGRLSSSA